MVRVLVRVLVCVPEERTSESLSGGTGGTGGKKREEDPRVAMGMTSREMTHEDGVIVGVAPESV